MPRTKGVEKAQIRLRVAKDLVEYVTGKGGLWLENVIRRERWNELPLEEKLRGGWSGQ